MICLFVRNHDRLEFIHLSLRDQSEWTNEYKNNKKTKKMQWMFFSFIFLPFFCVILLHVALTFIFLYFFFSLFLSSYIFMLSITNFATFLFFFWLPKFAKNDNWIFCSIVVSFFCVCYIRNGRYWVEWRLHFVPAHSKKESIK